MGAIVGGTVVRPGSAGGGPAAAGLRGFGPSGIAAILVILAGAMVGPIVSAPLVLLWAWLSRTPLRDLGFARSAHGVRAVALAVGIGVAFKLAMKALVMPLLGAPPQNPAYQFLVGNTAALPAAIAMVIVSAGFGEELLFRAWFFERLGRLLGRSPAALAGMVVLSAALFGLAHYPDQRLAGVEQAVITGLLFGAIYARWRRIWFVMIAHAAFDLAAVAIIYAGWERVVAQWLIR